MFLLNAETTIEWEILATASPPALGDLDLVQIDPNGQHTYLNAPIQAGDYTPPTAVSNGTVIYRITPQLEGFWRIRLVTGTSDAYQILDKVEMWVFDNTVVTTPYSDEIGRPAPYDINFFMQGYVVPVEIFGTFIASRSITLATNVPGSEAKAEESPEFFETTFLIKYNGVQIGTIVFPINQVTGVITCAAQLINPGDRITVESGPGVMDARIHDIAVNLVGCCTVVPCTVL